SRDDDDLVLPGRVDEDQRDARRPAPLELELDARVIESLQRAHCEGVVPDGADHAHARTEARGGDGLIRAFAARKARELAPADGLARPRKPLDERNEVEVDRPDHGQLYGHRARAYSRAAGRLAASPGDPVRPAPRRRRATFAKRVCRICSECVTPAVLAGGSSGTVGMLPSPSTKRR